MKLFRYIHWCDESAAARVLTLLTLPALLGLWLVLRPLDRLKGRRQ